MSASWSKLALISGSVVRNDDVRVKGDVDLLWTAGVCFLSFAEVKKRYILMSKGILALPFFILLSKKCWLRVCFPRFVVFVLCEVIKVYPTAACCWAYYSLQRSGVRLCVRPLGPAGTVWLVTESLKLKFSCSGKAVGWNRQWTVGWMKTDKLQTHSQKLEYHGKAD